MALINRNKLDPITMYATSKIELMLTREEMTVPDKDDSDVQRDKLIRVCRLLRVFMQCCACVCACACVCVCLCVCA